MVEDKVLPSGYRFIRLHRERFAQLPPGFIGEIVPDEFIFHPEWNREAINAYWRQHQPRAGGGRDE